MSVFALLHYVFWKYVFMHMEYVVLLLNIFSYFMEMYDNLSTSKYVYITVLFLKSSSNIQSY